MRRRLVRTVGGGSALALALAIGACSKSEQLEDKIAESFEEDVGIEGVEVTCPGDVDANEGDVVECDATGDFSELGIDADRITLEVTFTSDNEFEVTNFTPAQ